MELGPSQEASVTIGGHVSPSHINAGDSMLTSPDFTTKNNGFNISQAYAVKEDGS